MRSFFFFCGTLLLVWTGSMPAQTEERDDTCTDPIIEEFYPDETLKVFAEVEKLPNQGNVEVGRVVVLVKGGQGLRFENVMVKPFRELEVGSTIEVVTVMCNVKYGGSLTPVYFRAVRQGEYNILL